VTARTADAASAADLRRSQTIAEGKMNNTQSAAQLRRSWIGGVRPEDVDSALDELARHNEELAAELAASQATIRELAERVTSAEGKLQAFHASIEHAGNLLSVAEERARETVAEAELYSTRVGSAAEERVRTEEAEIAALTARKRETVNALTGLRSRLTAPADEPVAAREEEPPPRRLTVADLLAMEAEGRL
jgi:chromosome segregation ATPase